MKSLRIAHFSNLYLYYNFEKTNVPPDVGKNLRSSVKSKFVEIMENLSNKNIDVLIFSGNTVYFDDALPKDLEEFNSILKKFGHKIFIVPGNIDPYSFYSKFNFSDNIFIFPNDKISKVDIGEGVFYGIGGPLRSFELIESVSTSPAELNVFCAFTPDNSDFENKNVVLNNFDYVACSYTRSGEFSNDKVYFSGPFTSYDWNVIDNNYLISYVGDSTNSVSKILSNVYKFYSVTINFSKKMDMVSYIKSILDNENYKSNILKVYLEGRNFEFINFENLKKELKDRFLYLEFINNLVPDKRSLKKLESSFAELTDDKMILYKGVEFLRGKGGY